LSSKVDNLTQIFQRCIKIFYIEAKQIFRDLILL